jgi:hypothetical protein
LAPGVFGPQSLIAPPTCLRLILFLDLLDVRRLPLLFLDLFLVLARRDLAIIYYGTKRIIFRENPGRIISMQARL